MTISRPWMYQFFSVVYILLFIYLAVLGFHYCTRTFSSCDEQGLLFAVVLGLLIAVASLVVEHRLESTWVSGVEACGLSCPLACGIFLDQGLNLCLLHWQVDSLPLSYQGSPEASNLNEVHKLKKIYDEIGGLSVPLYCVLLLLLSIVIVSFKNSLLWSSV